VRAVVDGERRGGDSAGPFGDAYFALRAAQEFWVRTRSSKVRRWMRIGLRFDFTNLSAVTGEQLSSINADVCRRELRVRRPVRWDTMPLAEARKEGAMIAVR